MTFETWLAFLLASVAMLAIPGPTILLSVGRLPAAGAGFLVPPGVGLCFTPVGFATAGIRRT